MGFQTQYQATQLCRAAEDKSNDDRSNYVLLSSVNPTVQPKQAMASVGWGISHVCRFCQWSAQTCLMGTPSVMLPVYVVCGIELLGFASKMDA
jgi:hypothetical protein